LYSSLLPLPHPFRSLHFFRRGEPGSAALSPSLRCSSLLAPSPFLISSSEQDQQQQQLARKTAASSEATTPADGDSRLPLLFISSRVNRQQPATGENTTAARSPALFFGKAANHQRNSMRRLLRLKIPVMQRRSIEFFKYGALLRDGSSTDPSK
ncbi:hypothetical protein AABB24_000576, partial [Solanum stoloniferum]